MYDFALLGSQLQVDKVVFHNYINFNIIEAQDQWHPIGNSTEIKKQLFFQIQRIKKESLNCKEIDFPKLNIANHSQFKKKCERFFKALAFDAYGNIGSCGRVMNPSRKYGNILIWNEKDVWNGKYMQYMRGRFLNKRKEIPQCCYSCIENF